MINPFFKNKGPIKINEILTNININKKKIDISISDIKDLVSATGKDISFFHSKKYESAASVTQASYCVTTLTLM